MTNTTWDLELKRFSALTGLARQKWLADLLFVLTVFARDTYTVQGNGLDDPERMRRFNELIHRVVNQLRSEINGARGMPEDLFRKLVAEEAEVLGVGAGDLRKLIG